MFLCYCSFLTGKESLSNGCNVENGKERIIVSYDFYLFSNLNQCVYENDCEASSGGTTTSDITTIDGK